jgi:hypothetical protein
MIDWLHAHHVMLLKLAACAQFVVAILNFRLVALLGWRAELGRVSLLMREVFHVHLWFISFTLMIFAALTWKFAAEMMADNEIADWLALGIGLFWGMRAVLQITYYSASHWWGKLAPTMVHIALLLMYGGMCAVYCSAGIGALNAWHSH